MLAYTFIDFLGLTAAAIGVVTGVPQVLRLLRNPDASGVSAASSLLGVLSSGSWLLYGLLLLDPAQLVANVPGLAAALVTAVLAYHRLGARQLHGQLLTAGYAALLAGVWVLAGASGVGAAATVVSLVKMAPQIRLVLRGGSLAGLAPATFALATAAAVLWTVYGAAQGQVSVVVCSALSALMSGFVLVRRCPPRVVVRALHAGRWGTPGQLLVRPVLALLLNSVLSKRVRVTVQS
ncbi:SemiSWEET family transporter, partial [Kineococcus glutinatus]|uniref:SemiSWEET family transporter n=1 Tax=Kineococcus glutinatus TaxID=1070872 RepID=UPI0031ECDF21